MVARIRSDILTEGCIRDRVKVVDREMGGVAREQRKRLKAIVDELQDVKRQLDRIWRYIGTSDTVMAEPRIASESIGSGKSGLMSTSLSRLGRTSPSAGRYWTT